MADEKLRIYKHGSVSYNDVTSATVGGFSDLIITKVRNAPGSLEFTLRATTAAIVAGWLDEASTIEVWMDGSKKDVYIVDDYTIDWSVLECRVKCVGLLILGRDVKYTGAFTGVSAKSALQTLIGQVSRWAWDAAAVATGPTIDNINYEDKNVDEAIQEICLLTGFNFWFSTDYKFHAGATPTAIDQTFELNANCRDFTTTYTARDIINQVILTTAAGIFTYNDTDSQEAYGIKSQKISKSWIASETQAANYAYKILAYSAFPKQEIGATVDYDAGIAVGQAAEITGLADGRTYEALIQQARWGPGDLTMEILMGAAPLSLAEGIDPAPATDPPGTPDEPPSDPPDEFPPDLPPDSVTEDEIAPDAVGPDQLQDDAVGTDELQDDAVTPDKASDDLKRRVMIWYVAGDAAEDTNVSAEFEVPQGFTILAAIAHCKTAPDGAAILIDINVDGSSVWNDPDNRLAIADGETSGTQATIGNDAVSSGSVLTVDIDQVGSGTAGADLTIELTMVPV